MCIDCNVSSLISHQNVHAQVIKISILLNGVHFVFTCMIKLHGWFVMPVLKRSIVATVFESIFYSLHTVAVWPHSTNHIAFWQNSSRHSEATLIQWNDTFYKSFGLADLHNVKWKSIFAIEQLSDIQFDTINNLFKGKSYLNWKGKVAMLPSVSTNLQFHRSTIITSPYDYLSIEKVTLSDLLIKQPRYGGSRRQTQILWLATMEKEGHIALHMLIGLPQLVPVR